MITANGSMDMMNLENLNAMEKVKILAIDDNTEHIVVLEAIVAEAFPRAIFISAITAKSGIKLCLAEKPEVLLLRMEMPETDGSPIWQILKEDKATKSIPIIMVTESRNDKENRARALKTGVDAFLTMPLDETELTAQIRAVLRIKDLETRLKESKQIEKALQESENRFQMLFNKAPMGYQSLDFAGHFIEVNQQWLDTLGYERQEVIGKWFGDFLSPDYQDGFRKRFPLFKSLGQIHSEFEMIHKNGTKLNIAFEGKIGYDLNGNFKQTHCILQDITESKRAEKALLESQTLYHTFIEQLPVAVFRKDTEGRYILVNSQYCKLKGLNKVDILGKKPSDVAANYQSTQGEEGLLTKYACLGEDIHEQILRTNKIVETEEEYPTIDGLKQYMQVLRMPVVDLNGRIIGTQGIIFDISERKRAEEALREREQLFQGLFNASPDAIVLIDPNHPDISWPIVDCNEASCRMNGYSRQEMIGQSIDMLNITEGLSRERIEYFDNLKREGIIHIETTHRHKDGHSFPVEVSTSIITIGGHEMVLGIDRDITERKNTEERIKESEEKFRMVFENVFDGIVIYEEYHDFSQRKLIDCNKQYADMAGLTIEELLKYKNTNDIQISLEESSNDARLESLSTRKAFRGSYSWIRPDGKDNIIEFIGVPVIWRGKSYTIGMDRDITESKKAEAELIVAKEQAEESEQQLKIKNEELTSKNKFIQIILDNLPIGISLNKISEGDATFMNKKFQKIYGWTSNEISSVATFFEKVYPDVTYRNELIDRIMNDIQSGDPEKMHWEDIVVTQKDGTQRIVNAVNIPLNEQNTMISTVVDITERKQAELALKASEERYRSFISQVSEGVYRFECDKPMDLSLPLEEQVDYVYDHFFIAECNQAILNIYGLSNQNEMIGKTQMHFHGGRNNPVNRDTLRKYIRNGFTVENGITEEYDRTGHKKYLSNNSIGIIEDNHLVRIWGTETDVTEKVRADQIQQVLYAISNAALSSIDLSELIQLISQEIGKLLDSTNFYIAFYDEKTDMLSTIYERDEKDVIETWPAENSITGYVIKKQKSVLIKDIELNEFCDAAGIEQFGTPSKVWLGVPLLMNKKAIGAVVVQSYENQNAYTEKDKQMLEFISHQISISIERKKAEQELNEALIQAKESDRLKSAFLANMSHEIRTPLNSIIGFSDLLFNPEFDMAQQKEFAEMINISGNSLLVIINDIMDISKIEAGLVHLNKNVFSVQKLMHNIRNEYSFKALEKDIELKLDPLNPNDEILIESDENKLRQILINLVGNAIKFTGKGFIELGLRTEGKMVRFHVKDTGIGISPEYHDKIFDRFRQVESSDSRKYGGNGLGLAISRSLAELLGGEIRIESKEGIGSTFYLTIPIS
jgi:PAS domain S-box-containing protein